MAFLKEIKNEFIIIPNSGRCAVMNLLILMMSSVTEFIVGLRMSHTWYRMQECVVHRSIKNVDREPSE